MMRARENEDSDLEQQFFDREGNNLHDSEYKAKCIDMTCPASYFELEGGKCLDRAQLER